MDSLCDIEDVVAVLGSLLSDPSLRGKSSEEIDDRFLTVLADTVAEEQVEETNVSPWGTSTLAIGNFSISRSGNADSFPAALKICVPMPDELLGSWVGRMASLNCLSSQKAVMSRMLDSARQVDPDLTIDSDITKFGPVVLQVSRDVFLKHLTFDAFNRALVGPSPNKPGTKSPKHLAAYQRHINFKLPGEALRFCRECHREDLERHGFSYWRRAHQLAGVLWCSVHDVPLFIASSGAGYEASPGQTPYLNNDRIEALPAHQISALKRYAYVVTFVLQNPPRVNGAAASEVFAQQSKRMGLRTGKIGKRKLVSTHLQEVLPLWWLAETFPKVKWQARKHISAIDSACTPSNTQRYTTNTFSLLASTFFENVEDAISVLMNPQRRPAREKGAAYWSRREIFDLYVQNQGVIHKVAEDLKMNPQTVYNGLRNQGLPAFGKSTRIRTTLTHFLAGAPLIEVCSSKEEMEALEDVVRAACTPCQLALAAIEREERSNSRIDSLALGVGN